MKKITLINLLILFIVTSSSLFAQAPANDTCAGVIDLGTLTSPISATTTNASNNYTNGCLNALAPDIVYSITVPIGFILTINQPNNSYDSVVRIAYGGTCPGDTTIDCFDGPDLLVNEWTNDTGVDQVVYWVQSGFNNNSGDFELAWSLDSTLGVEGFVLDSFKLYPNPTSLDYVNISSKNSETINASVFDILGKQIINTTVVNKKLDVSNLKTGIYILRLTQNNISITKKMVIK